MSGWQDNAIMFWGGTKVTDHGRSPLSMSTERIGTDTRMANGTLRRHQVSKKRTWSVSWEMIPSTNAVGSLNTVDGGMCGNDIEGFYDTTDGSFVLTLRRGSAINKISPTSDPNELPFKDDDFDICMVMITEFNKEIIKRGPKTDFWSLDITLAEV